MDIDIPDRVQKLKVVEGRAIRRLRKATPRLTQEKVADALQCSPGRVSEWENGKVRPEPPTLVRLLEVLGRSVADYAVAFAEEARAGDQQERPAAQRAGRPLDSAPRDEVREGPQGSEPTSLPDRYGDEVVQIQIRELTLVIPADRFSIGPADSRPHPRQRDW